MVKKKRKKSPNALAIDELRKYGYEPAVVESVIPRTFIKRDLWGWCDIIAINGVNTLGVQVTSGGGSKGESNAKARKRKILAEPRALIWIQSGNLLELWNWLDDKFVKEEIVAADFVAPWDGMGEEVA